mmetsp:Transcript_16093/g.23683  ORF Transcript_16093/g.23683 Transcript_16093/m.23683 type:complete len:422 (+) Transcript_16093:123-1388(+)
MISDDEDVTSCCASVEDPPFAFVDMPETVEKGETRQSHDSDKCTYESPAASQETGKTLENSSILYSSSHSQTNTPSSNILEFDAAVSLLAESPYFLEKVETEKPKHSALEPISCSKEFSRDDKEYSLLMQAADNEHSFLNEENIPYLPDSESLSSMQTSKIENRSVIGSFGTADEMREKRTPVSSFMKRGIEIENVDEDSFEVSMCIYSPCTIRDIMDIIGNPDMLRLWCEPVRALVVTRSSEGSRSATNRTESTSDREYDGEWVEATTPELLRPSSHSGTFYEIGQHIWSNLGFPSYGKITMFVERQRGQVGITMGPFPGGLTAFHTIRATECSGYVKVMDRVRIGNEDQQSSNICCCNNIYEGVKRCFMPRQLDGHKEQAVASITRLRIMVENGESELYSKPLTLESEEEGASSIPLLS